MNKIELLFLGNSRSAVAAARETDAALGGLGKTTTKTHGIFRSLLGPLGAVGALTALGAAAHAGFDEMQDHLKVAAQTGAVLKSTGGAANVTAKEIDELAGSLLRKTGVDDEAIQSGENMILTFKGIRNEAGAGNDIFNQTTKAVLDMDTAMSHGNVTAENLSKTSILVGKALQDPIKGATALRRVGVDLNETQKEQIEHFVKLGDTMDAQKVILKELNSEFGGSAEAMGKTLPGQISIAREEFRNFTGDLVEKAIPAVKSMIDYVVAHWPQIMATIGPIMAQIKLIIGEALTDARLFWERFGGTILAILSNIKVEVRDALTVVQAIFKVFGDLLRGDWSALWHDLGQVVSAMLTLIQHQIQAAGTLIVNAMEGLGRLALRGLEAGLSGLAGLIRDALNAGLSAIGDLAKSALSKGEDFGISLLKGFAHGLEGFGQMLVKAIVAPLNAVIGAWDAISFNVHVPGVATHIPGVGTIGGFDFGFQVPQIPKLAAGGIVTSPTLAMIGEAGPEAVIPLDRFGGGVQVNVTFANGFMVGNKREIGAAIADSVQSAIERLGPGMALAR